MLRRHEARPRTKGGDVEAPAAHRDGVSRAAERIDPRQCRCPARTARKLGGRHVAGCDARSRGAKRAKSSRAHGCQPGRRYQSLCGALRHLSWHRERRRIGVARGERALSPAAAQLATDGVEDDSEGFSFWKIAHGIRWTGMPSWKSTLSDEQIWTLALFLKHMDKLPPAARQA